MFIHCCISIATILMIAIFEHGYGDVLRSAFSIVFVFVVWAMLTFAIWFMSW